VEGREYPLAVAVGLAILHVLDDTFVGRQPGTSVADELFASSSSESRRGAMATPRVRLDVAAGHRPAPRR
jgi:hypothetical protein